MQEFINIGLAADDGTGDPLRTGAEKINANFSDLYAQLSSLLALTQEGAMNIVVDASLVVRPENYGGANAGLIGAFAAATVTAGVVSLSPGGTYTVDRDMVVPDGIKLIGVKSATIKRANQVTGILLTGFTAGTTAKTFNVSPGDAAKFAVGQTVMIVRTDGSGTISPNDPYTHGGRAISLKVDNGDGTWAITLAAGGNVQAHAAGDVLATTCCMLRCQGHNLLQGFTSDGNAANQTYAHWITSGGIAQEGDDVRLDGMTIQHTPSDAFLCGGPNGGLIYGSTMANCVLSDIGNNGCHYGNVRRVAAINNRAVKGNARFLLPLEQGGSGPTGRGGHMDGFWIYSNDVADGRCIGNHIEDWICGVGALGSTMVAGAGVTVQTNDDTIAALNVFKNCQHDIEVIEGTKRLVFGLNKHVAEAFSAVNGTYNGNNRWTDHAALYATGDASQGRIENLTYSLNTIKNGRIDVDRVRSFGLDDNTIDNRELGAAGHNTDIYYGMLIRNYNGGTASRNKILGGNVSIFLQNGFGTGDYCRDLILSENVCLNPYTRGLSGSLVAGSGLTGTVCSRNIVRADTAMTMEDGVTLVPVNGAAQWVGITIWKGMQTTHNRVAFNNAGAAAFDTAQDAATAVARRWNYINDVPELPSNFANDAAAATGNAGIGVEYRNGSVLQVRVA